MKSVYKSFLLLLIVLVVPIPLCYSHDIGNMTPTVRERTFFGGNLGLQFGTVTDIELSPIIGYWLFPRVSVAAGPQYRFYKYYDTKAQIVGGKAYCEYYFIQDVGNVMPFGKNIGLFFHIEDEMLRVLSDSSMEGPYSINTIFFGGGISQSLGGRSSANIMALWAIGGSGYGYYSNPEIRFVFTF